MATLRLYRTYEEQQELKEAGRGFQTRMVSWSGIKVRAIDANARGDLYPILDLSDAQTAEWMAQEDAVPRCYRVLPDGCVVLSNHALNLADEHDIELHDFVPSVELNLEDETTFLMETWANGPYGCKLWLQFGHVRSSIHLNANTSLRRYSTVHVWSSAEDIRDAGPVLEVRPGETVAKLGARLKLHYGESVHVGKRNNRRNLLRFNEASFVRRIVAAPRVNDKTPQSGCTIKGSGRRLILDDTPETFRFPESAFVNLGFRESGAVPVLRFGLTPSHKPVLWRPRLEEVPFTERLINRLTERLCTLEQAEQHVSWHLPWPRVFVFRGPDKWRFLYQLPARMDFGMDGIGEIAYLIPVTVDHAECKPATQTFRGMPLDLQRAIWAVPGMSMALEHARNTLLGQIAKLPYSLDNITYPDRGRQKSGQVIPAGHGIGRFGGSLYSTTGLNVSDYHGRLHNVAEVLNDAFSQITVKPTLLPGATQDVQPVAKRKLRRKLHI